MPNRTRLWGFHHFANRFINPITRLFAGRLPGFGVLTYRGRRSGNTYSTPVNVFRRDGDYIFFLTYGSDTNWVKNVLASGECWIRTGGRQVRLTRPEIIVDPARSLFPAPVRFVGRLAKVTEFLRMRLAPTRSQERVSHPAN
jgi:deazaflavin-dependent oxidoreductase (nitroreductase family)